MHRTSGSMLLLFAALLLTACGGRGGGGGSPPEPLETFLWTGTGAGNDYAAAVDAFPDGSTVLAAHVQGTLDLDGLGVSEALDDLEGSLVLVRLTKDGDLAWHRTDGASTSVEARDLKALADGSCLVTGIFTGTATFGVGDAAQTTFASRGGTDIFVARYASNGALLWAVRAGGSTVGDPSHSLIGDIVEEIDAYADGSFVIAGEFSSNLGFGEAPDRLILAGAGGGFSTFVARYESDGTLRWAHEIRYTPAAYTHVAARSDGSCVVIGLTPGDAPPPAPPGTELTLRFGGVTLRRSAVGWMYMAAIDAAGTVLWVRGEGRDAHVVPQDLAVDADGSFVVAGEIDGTLFGLDGSPGLRTNDLPGRHAFLGRFDASGSAVWARKDDVVAHNQVALRTGGNPIVLGAFLDIGTLGMTQLASTAGWGAYLARFNADGTFEAARKEGGDGLGLFTYPADLAVLRDGRIALAGSFQGELLIGQDSLAETTVTSRGSWDFLFAVYFADTSFEILP